MTWHPGMTIADVEKETILKALRFHAGHRQRTADSLGIAVRTLSNKLKEYGVSSVEDDPPPTPPEPPVMQEKGKKKK